MILRIIIKNRIEGAINKYLGDKRVKKFNTKNHLTAKEVNLNIQNKVQSSEQSQFEIS